MFVHSLPFDPTYGYDLEALQRVPPAPEPIDFAHFWKATFAEAAAIPARPRARPAAHQPFEDHEVFELTFNALGLDSPDCGAERFQPIRAWLTVPRHGPISRGLVISHGYGGREGPDATLAIENAAAIYPCARGIALSRDPSIPGESSLHVLHGIGSRETYIHRGCAADLWAAATALIELVPAAAQRLDYLGTSFGGGIGALALPWDRRFHGAFLGLPSFGQHPIRLGLPCEGSGESVRRYAETHPEIRAVLSYFDASVAANHLTIPTMVAAARFDPVVPPPGQFAVYNALAGRKELLVLPAGHFAYPAQFADDESVADAIKRWLR